MMDEVEQKTMVGCNLIGIRSHDLTLTLCTNHTSHHAMN